MICVFFFFFFFFFFLMIRRPPRSTQAFTLFPTRRSSDLNKNFEVQLERVTSEPQCQEALSLLKALQDRRWGVGGSDTFYPSPVASFHEEFARVALARGWLRLFVLRLNGKPAASLYG